MTNLVISEDDLQKLSLLSVGETSVVTNLGDSKLVNVKYIRIGDRNCQDCLFVESSCKPFSDLDGEFSCICTLGKGDDYLDTIYIEE